MKFTINTLGCKVNTYESEVMKENLIKAGYTLVSENKDADIIIINTCTVTNQSDAKSRKLIRQARRENKDAIICVCGCSSQHHKEELLDLDVQILLGNHDKSKTVYYIEEYLKNKKKIVKFYDMQKVPFDEMKLDNYSDRTRAFIKIQDGCNNYCSYCIIPYMRGNIRFKDYDAVLDEVKCLVNNGFKEIVLTGIHTGSYPRFTSLIHDLSLIDGLERIRISSIEITELDDEFINELKVNNKICDHIHIPIQSASNNVLKKMNRKYDIDKFIEIINKIREVRPNINITTDLIVGFPTETEEDFKECLENATRIKFGKIHVFPYSKRDGTAASFMKNIVTDIDKKKRTHEMLELSNKLENEYISKLIGKKLNVLIEEAFDDKSIGHTSNYIKVIINERLVHNENYNVEIKEIKDNIAYGILCK